LVVSCRSFTAHVSVGWSGWSTLLIDLLHDRIELSFHLLLLGFILCCLGVWVALEELDSFFDDIVDQLLVFFRELVLHFVVVEYVLDLEAVAFESILGVDLLTGLLVFVLVLLGVLNHLLNFFG